MADAKVLKNNFNKAELLGLAEQNNLELVVNGEPLNEENTNAELSEAIAAQLTAEQVDQAIEAKKAAKANVQTLAEENDEDNSEPDPAEPADPAAAPAGEDVASGDHKFSVGERVLYPHKDSHGGYRRGRILGLTDTTATVTYIDGTGRDFGLGVLKQA